MGSVTLDWRFMSGTRLVDVIRVHAKYYELYLRIYCIKQYVWAQRDHDEGRMEMWRSHLDMTADELLDPMLPVHDDGSLRAVVERVERTESWMEIITALRDWAVPVAETYRLWNEYVKQTLPWGKKGFDQRVLEEAERQFRHDLIQASGAVSHLAKEISQIRDAKVRQGAAASIGKVVRELDESLRRSKARLLTFAGDADCALPPPTEAEEIASSDRPSRSAIPPVASSEGTKKKPEGREITLKRSRAGKMGAAQEIRRETSTKKKNRGGR